MSFLNDEDELFISPSSADAFTNRQQAKEKAKERKAKQKGKLLSLKRLILRGKVTEDETENQSTVETPETFGTKTNKQREETAVINAQKEFTADDLVEESYRETEKKADEEEERASEDV